MTGSGRYPGSAPIESYGNGGFRFAGMSHRGSILCLPSAIIAWPVTSAAALSAADLVPIIEAAGEAPHLLLGTGARHVFPPPWVLHALAQAGIHAEVMTTGAAARTYNILLAEKRVVAAALIAVD